MSIKKSIGLLSLLLTISCNHKQNTEQNAVEENNIKSEEKIGKSDSGIDSNKESMQVKDIVKLGNQIWSTENLNTSVFRNGDSICQARTREEWEQAGKEEKPAWCYYNNSSGNDSIYGKLYNWYAVNDKRGLAPNGWRIPNEKDWQHLVKYFGGVNVLSSQLMSDTGWKYENGTNESGFNALPSGGRFNNGKFDNLLTDAFYWSRTEKDKSNLGGEAVCFILNYHLPMVTSLSKNYGLSVRCIMESEN